MALTKELVETHHGEITVASIPDKSTTFKVILPVDKAHYKEDEIVEAAEKDLHEPAISIPDKSGSPLRSDQHSRQHRLHPEDSSGLIHPGINLHREARGEKREASILIVEDNSDVTRYICSFLENDYRILTAENGKEGLKKAIAKYPELIISDVMIDRKSVV